MTEQQIDAWIDLIRAIVDDCDDGSDWSQAIVREEKQRVLRIMNEKKETET